MSTGVLSGGWEWTVDASDGDEFESEGADVEFRTIRDGRVGTTEGGTASFGRSGEDEAGCEEADCLGPSRLNVEVLLAPVLLDAVMGGRAEVWGSNNEVWDVLGALDTMVGLMLEELSGSCCSSCCFGSVGSGFTNSVLESRLEFLLD